MHPISIMLQQAHNEQASCTVPVVVRLEHKGLKKQTNKKTTLDRLCHTNRQLAAQPLNTLLTGLIIIRTTTAGLQHLQKI